MKISRYLEKIDSIAKYVATFGSVFNKEERRTVPFTLWPLQRKLLNNLDRDQKLGFNRTWIPKARQLGISELAAERAVMNMLKYDKFQVIVVSKKADDAEYFLEWRVKCKVEYLAKRAKQLEQASGVRIEVPTIVKATQEKIVLSNGSVITALPATGTSGASMTADAIILDEAGGFDLLPGASLEDLWRNILPTIEKAGRLGWIMVIGTSEPGTFFNDRIRKLLNNGSSQSKMYFLPWYTDPNRTQEWVKAQKEEMVNEVNFRLQYPETIHDFFAVKTGLVIPEFENTLQGNVTNRDKIDWGNAEIIVGYDHGSTEAHKAFAVFCLYWKEKNLLYVWKELVFRGEAVYAIAPAIKAVIAQMPKPPRRLIADTAIHKNDGVKSVAETFAEYGIYWSKSQKHDEQGSLELVRRRCIERKVIVDEDCMELREEFVSWKYDKNGVKPEDKNNDGIDAIKYICAEIQNPLSEKNSKFITKTNLRYGSYRPGKAANPSSEADYDRTLGAEQYREAYQMM